MDYNVKYKLSVDSIAAIKSLNKFQNTCTSVFGKFDKLTDKSVGKVNKVSKSVNNLDKSLKNLNKKKITVKISSQTTSSINKVKRDLDEIRNGGKKKKRRGSRGSRVGQGGVLGKTFKGSSFLSASGIPFAATLGAGLAGIGLRNIIDESIQFENVMTSARSILRSTDSDLSSFNTRFSDLSSQMRQIGVDTKFTAVEIGGATKFLAMAGLTISDISKAMPAVTNAAIIADTDIQNTADIVTNIMTGYGAGAEKLTTMVDIMSSVTTRANVDLLQMGESMKFASSYMGIAGVSFNEGAAAIGVLANAGIRGTLAGTGIRAMMIRMIAPTKKAKKIMDALGISFTKVEERGGKQVEVLKNIPDIMQELKDKGATTQQITGIFDKIAGAPVNILLNNIEKLRELTAASKTAGGLSDFLSEEKMNTVLGLSQQLKSKFLDIGMTMYNNMKPAILSVMNAMMKFMQGESAATMMDKFKFGVEGIIDSVRAGANFIYKNWGWIKYMLGAFVINKAALSSISYLRAGFRSLGNTISMLAFSPKKAIEGLVSSFYKLVETMSSAGAMKSALKSFVAPLAKVGWAGLVVGGITAIGFAIKNTYDNIRNIKDKTEILSDWSVSNTGLNTESLDIIRKKLDGISQVSTDIIKSKQKIVDSQQLKDLKSVIDSAGGVSFWEKFLFSSGDTKGYDLAKQSQEDRLAPAVREFAIGQAGSDINAMIRKASLDIANEKFDSKTFKSNVGDLFIKKARMGVLGLDEDSTREDVLSTKIGMSAYNRTIRARYDQIIKLQEVVSKNDPTSALEALNMIMPNKSGLLPAIDEIRKTGVETLEDKRSILSKYGVSIPKIRANLGSIFSSELIDKLFSVSELDKLLGTIVTTDPSTKLTGGSGTTSGDADAELTGTGKLHSRSASRYLHINIENLVQMNDVDVNEAGDLDTFKNMVADALTDVVNDFSLSNP